MGEDQVNFQPQGVAVLSDGREIVPESQAEMDFLTNVVNSNRTDAEKERIASMGALFSPTTFDINFSNDKRAKLPTDLDPQLRQMIRES